MNRYKELVKSILLLAVFTLVLLGVKYYNNNSEIFFELFGDRSAVFSNAYSLDEFKATYGWGIENLQVLEDRSGIMFNINCGNSQVYTPNKHWYSSIGVKSYAMKLSLRANIDREPLELVPDSQGVYTLYIGNDRIGVGTRQAITKFRVDGKDYYWVLLYNVDHNHKISDLESKILADKR